MRAQQTRLAKLLGAMLLASMCCAVQPGWAVTLMPLTLVMPRDKAVVSLNVRNDDTGPRTYEVEVYRWSQAAGSDVLEPAGELIVTPPIMTLASGEERMIRIGMLRTGPARSEEKSFRVLLKDITPVKASDAAPLRLRMQYLLPLFLSPDRPRSRVELSRTASADGGDCIAIANAGNTHAKLVTYGQASGARELAPANQYVLPGQQRVFCAGDPSIATGDGITTAGFTSAYQNDVTLYDVPPS